MKFRLPGLRSVFLISVLMFLPGGMVKIALANSPATVLDLPLDKNKGLKSLAVSALAYEAVIGLMSITLIRRLP